MARGTTGSGSRLLTLDDLLALNEEIIALARAGVPLDRGLMHLGRDMPGRLGAMTRAVAQRLEEGQTLAQVAAADDTPFPPLYRALVRAGTETGHLPETLQLLSGIARRTSEIRASLRAALVYPLVVIALGYSLLIVALLTWVPAMHEVIHGFEMDSGPLLEGVSVARATILWWAPWLPLLVLALVFYTLRTPARIALERRPTRSWWPTLRSVRDDCGHALVADVMAVLVEHHVPLDEALVLAGDASGDALVAQQARELAARLRQGERLEKISPDVPPFLAWLVISTRDLSMLVSGLRNASSFYRQRAEMHARWLSTYLPALLTLVIGGCLVLIYAMVVLGPWYQLLYRLS